MFISYVQIFNQTSGFPQHLHVTSIPSLHVAATNICSQKRLAAIGAYAAKVVCSVVSEQQALAGVNYCQGRDRRTGWSRVSKERFDAA
eukprot:6135876-Pleurochrysis_carterae.AAC.1